MHGRAGEDATSASLMRLRDSQLPSAGYGTTPVTSTLPFGRVPSTTPLSAVMINRVEALALSTGSSVRGSQLRASRLVSSSNRTSAMRCAGFEPGFGFSAAGAVPAQQLQVASIGGLLQVSKPGAGQSGHQHSHPRVAIDP